MLKALLIGGTGTLGNALLPKLLKRGYIVSVLSRDELKQKNMKKKYPNVEFIIGDVRDRSSLDDAVFGCDVVFHLAAMKHVEVCEENIGEALKINLLGTQNVVDACLAGGVNYAVFSSTDKAVLPINTYGFCKGLSERLWHDANRKQACLFTVFRWGNVIGSRGSVVHAFKESIASEKKAYITDFDMTRFWIHIDDAASFMIDNYRYKNDNSVYIPPMKAAKVSKIARAVAIHLGVDDLKFEKIPIRAGEKMHEWLDFQDPDFEIKSNTCPQYSDDEILEIVARVLNDLK